MSEKLILIVDDEKSICDAMSDLLDLKGYEIVVASNGVEGLKICAERPVDLIILDLNMPRMDGYMFLERLSERRKAEKDNRPLPKVLVMTAVEKKTDLGLAKNKGATAFMNKPFKSNEFIDVVEKLVE